MKAKTIHQREKQILNECLKKLDFAKVEKVETNSGDLQTDVIFELAGTWGRRRYLAEIRMAVTSRDVQIQKSRSIQKERGLTPILLTRYVNPELGEEFKAAGIEYVDTAGNMYLHAPPLLVDVTGKRPPKPMARPHRTFHTKAIQLIHAFLRNPALLNSTYREMASVANVALGSVGLTLDELRQQKLLGRGSNGKRVLIDPVRLLERWEAAYLDVLRPLLLQKRTRMIHEGFDHLREATQSSDNGRWMIGGELAASLVTGHLVPQEATIFFWTSEKTVMKKLGLVEDANGPVHLLKAWSDHLEPDSGPEGAPVTDPILTRAELLREPDDRLFETATLLLEEHIKPRFKT